MVATRTVSPSVGNAYSGSPGLPCLEIPFVHSRPLRSRPVRRLTVSLLLVGWVLAATVPAPSNAQPQDDRPPDALLERTDLQAIVDAQVRRDGAALLERLDASDPAVRARAAFALASVQDTAAVPALL